MKTFLTFAVLALMTVPAFATNRVVRQRVVVQKQVVQPVVVRQRVVRQAVIVPHVQQVVVPAYGVQQFNAGCNNGALQFNAGHSCQQFFK